MKSVAKNCEVLGIDPTATPEQFKQAYRDLVRVWHPDRFSSDARLQRKAEQKLKEINDAHQQLQSFFLPEIRTDQGSRVKESTSSGNQGKSEGPRKPSPKPNRDRAQQTEDTSHRPDGNAGKANVNVGSFRSPGWEAKRFSSDSTMAAGVVVAAFIAVLVIGTRDFGHQLNQSVNVPT